MSTLKDFFHYTKTERNGALVLISLLFGFLFIPLLYPFFFTQETVDFSTFENEINAFEENVTFIEKKTSYTSSTKKEVTNAPLADPFPFDPNTATEEEFVQLGLSKKLAKTISNFRNKGGRFYKKEDLKKIYGLKTEQYERLSPFITLEQKEKQATNTTSKIEEEKKVIVLFNFDPNTATAEELKRLGLSAKAIKNMLNYRAKGGSFRKKEDLSKVYGLPKEQFQSLKPYIQLTESNPSDYKKDISKNAISKEQAFKKEKEPIIIDINKASIEEWQQLKGIGPYFAKKIYKFRESLGGFYAIDQIAETYKLPDSTFQMIKPFLKFSDNIKSININTATIDELAKHPYIDYKKAKVLIQYRKMHGDFKQVNDLKNIKAFKDEFIQKVLPYLKI